MCSEGYSTWFVCVYVSTAILALQAMGRLMSDTSGFRQRDLEKQKGDLGP